MTNEELRKKAQCPRCGGEISSTDLQCKSCGFEIPKAGITGESYIKELQEKIYQAGNDVFVISNVISTFAMPNDIEHLLEFLRFCDSSYEQNYSTVEVFSYDKNSTPSFVLASAWGEKAKSAYDRLLIATKDNQVIKSQISIFAIKYADADSVRKRIFKARTIKSIPVLPVLIFKYFIKHWFIFLIFLCLGSCAFIIIEDETRHAKIEENLQKKEIKAKEYLEKYGYFSSKTEPFDCIVYSGVMDIEQNINKFLEKKMYEQVLASMKKLSFEKSEDNNFRRISIKRRDEIFSKILSDPNAGLEKEIESLRRYLQLSDLCLDQGIRREYLSKYIDFYKKENDIRNLIKEKKYSEAISLLNEFVVDENSWSIEYYKLQIRVRNSLIDEFSNSVPKEILEKITEIINRLNKQQEAQLEEKNRTEMRTNMNLNIDI